MHEPRHPLPLTGAPLDMAALRAVLAGPVAASLPEAAGQRIAAGRAALERALAGGQPIYGTTTGVGAMKRTEHHGEALRDFNAGLALAHQVAVGEEMPPGLSRLVLALRLNTVAGGRVGVTPGFSAFLAQMLNHDLLPVLHARGSVGCGDLGQMGEVAAVMAGHGMAVLKGETMPAAEALARAGLAPYAMQPREGLAAVAVNAFGLARTAAAVIRAADAMRQAMAQSLTTAAAWGLDRAVWQAARQSLIPGEAALADWLLAATEGTAWPRRDSVHDALSGRFLVQIFAASLGAAVEAARSVQLHSAQVDDNPVILDGRVVASGASLLSDLSLRLATLQLAMAQLARNVLNRCLMLTGGQLPGLAVNLVPPGIIGTGYGPLMKLAQEQSVRITLAAQPAAPLNLPLAAGLEDEALLIPLAAERLDQQALALEWLLAIEALLAVQALDQRGLAPGRIAALQTAIVRRHFAPFTEDRPVSAPLSALRADLCAARGQLFAAAPFLPLDEEMALPSDPPQREGSFPARAGNTIASPDPVQ
ncbi:aromatic amino acid lyase [Pseudogemmobacter humi]|uniref:Histidine ammonia-lyase n=1 Tax=Pseudogemmobacter humi TaxID=2483812 RepID=A0A3P5WYT4_9RHOB|nr:aromatic amino acid lyase [Pseudogemmobacter humi]VDC26712.1 Histidine ammonia-lyase [Pseudogemmobacter humi]